MSAFSRKQLFETIKIALLRLSSPRFRSQVAVSNGVIVTVPAEMTSLMARGHSVLERKTPTEARLPIHSSIERTMRLPATATNEEIGVGAVFDPYPCHSLFYPRTALAPARNYAYDLHGGEFQVVSALLAMPRCRPGSELDYNVISPKDEEQKQECAKADERLQLTLRRVSLPKKHPIHEPKAVHVGRRLRQARLAAQLTSAELARQVNVCRQRISSAEQGRPLGQGILDRICMVLDVTLSYFNTAIPINAGTPISAVSSRPLRRNELLQKGCTYSALEWAHETFQRFGELIHLPEPSLPTTWPRDPSRHQEQD